MPRKNKVLWTTLIVLVLTTLYACRDFSFKNLNAQIYYDYKVAIGETSTFNYTHSLVEPILSKFNYKQLHFGKWILTGLFIIAFFLTNHFAAKLFNDPKLFRTANLALYTIIILIACALYTAGNYLIPINLMQFIQSPMPIMILTIGIRAYIKNNKVLNR